MALFFLQTFLLLLSAWGLWRLWRSLDEQPDAIRWIVAAGIAGRAVAGAVLFWVSYLQLNVARSLQLGDGAWFFALDGTSYMRVARAAAGRGLIAVLEISPTFPAVFYTRTLALFCWLFGTSTAVALLLNVFAYAGTVVVVARWAQLRRVPPRFALVPIIGLSFLPSWVLWSLQPLKDVFFSFLVVLFVYGVDRVALAWRERSERRVPEILKGTLLLLVSIYGLAGIRWYYATLALGLAVVTYIWTVSYARGAKQTVTALLVAATVVLMATELVVAGAGPYLPKTVRKVFRPFSQGSSLKESLYAPFAIVTRSRRGFDRVREGDTKIGAGPLLAGRSSASSPPAAAASASESTASKTRDEGQKTTTQVAAAPSKPAPSGSTGRAVETNADTTPGAARAADRETPVARPEVAGAGARAEAEGATAEGAINVPATHAARLISGFSALLLPRSVAVSLGLVSIGGGKGLWVFADLDTVAFDLLLLVSAVVVFRSFRRGAWRDPLVWFLVTISIVMATLLAYTISNYGTLFRHREMVATTACLLALSAARKREAAPAEEIAAVADPVTLRQSLPRVG
jgi:hypothetical protein